MWRLIISTFFVSSSSLIVDPQKQFGVERPRICLNNDDVDTPKLYSVFLSSSVQVHREKIIYMHLSCDKPFVNSKRADKKKVLVNVILDVRLKFAPF